MNVAEVHRLDILILCRVCASRRTRTEIVGGVEADGAFSVVVVAWRDVLDGEAVRAHFRAVGTCAERILIYCAGINGFADGFLSYYLVVLRKAKRGVADV